MTNFFNPKLIKASFLCLVFLLVIVLIIFPAISNRWPSGDPRNWLFVFFCPFYYFILWPLFQTFLLKIWYGFVSSSLFLGLFLILAVSMIIAWLLFYYLYTSIIGKLGFAFNFFNSLLWYLILTLVQQCFLNLFLNRRFSVKK